MRCAGRFVCVRMPRSATMSHLGICAMASRSLTSTAVTLIARHIEVPSFLLLGPRGGLPVGQPLVHFRSLFGGRHVAGGGALGGCAFLAQHDVLAWRLEGARGRDVGGRAGLPPQRGDLRPGDGTVCARLTPGACGVSAGLVRLFADDFAELLVAPRFAAMLLPIFNLAPRPPLVQLRLNICPSARRRHGW